jgi:hypothetical protein
MPLAYRQPGVRVSETVTPQISPLVAAPADIALVGRARGYQTRTDQFRSLAQPPFRFPDFPLGATVTSVDAVKDALIPPRVRQLAQAIRSRPTTPSRPAGTITRVGAGGIADGALVNVTYRTSLRIIGTRSASSTWPL